MFYIRHSYIHCLLIGYFKRFLEKSRNFVVNIIMIMLLVFDWCIQHVQCAQNGAFIARRACVIHKGAFTVRTIYALEKTIYGLKKTITAWKDYLWVEKDYLRLWPGFFGIVSLFLITWRTFNQSMNKNIWMPYIMVYIKVLFEIGYKKQNAVLVQCPFYFICGYTWSLVLVWWKGRNFFLHHCL